MNANRIIPPPGAKNHKCPYCGFEWRITWLWPDFPLTTHEKDTHETQWTIREEVADTPISNSDLVGLLNWQKIKCSLRLIAPIKGAATEF